jgi:hypothetical protein
MKHGSSTSRLVLGTLVFVLLVGVQTISFAHTFAHDAASFGDKACATCVSISQLAAAAIDTGAAPEPVVGHDPACSHAPVIAADRTPNAPNQRGPPQTS